MAIFWTQSVGVEVSGRDLRVAVIKGFFGRQRLARTEVIPGFLDLSESERLSVFKAFVKRFGLPHSRVYFTLSRDAGIVRQMEFPVQIADRLSGAAALQIETLSPWPIDEVYWSCSFVRPPKGSKSLRATIVIVPKATLDPWIAFFRTAGFPLSGASTSTATSAHGAAALWGSSVSMILLGCEPGSLESVLVNHGQLASIAAEAEDVSTEARPLVERLFSLAGFASPEGVTVFTHGAAAQDLDLDSVRLPLDGATVSSRPFFGAIATAFLGLRKSPFDVNLVPNVLRYRYSRIVMAPTFVLAFLLVLLGLSLFAREPYQNLIYADQIDREIGNLVPQVKDVSSQEAELELLNQHLVTLNAHIRNRDANLETLRELARVLPVDTWISSYSNQDPTVNISGLSASAAQVQKALEDSPVFKDAQLTSAVIKDSTGKDRFSIRAVAERAR